MRSIESIARLLETMTAGDPRSSQLFSMLKNCVERGEKISSSLAEDTQGDQPHTPRSIPWGQDQHRRQQQQQQHTDNSPNRIESIITHYKDDVQRGPAQVLRDRPADEIRKILTDVKVEMDAISLQLRFDATDISTIHGLNSRLRFLREVHSFYDRLDTSSASLLRASVDMGRRHSFNHTKGGRLSRSLRRRSKSRDVSTASFAFEHFRYRENTDKMLLVKDKAWMEEVDGSNTYPEKLIQVRIVQIASYVCSGIFPDVL